MKKFFKYIFFLTAISSIIIACDEEKNDIVYDEINGQTLVQFEKTSATLPTPEEGATFEFKISSSTKSDVDRKVSVSVDPTSTASTNQYQIGEVVIPAGSYFGSININTIFENIPEEGSSFLVLNITDIENSNDPVFVNSSISLELYRKCPVMPGEYVIAMQDVYGDGWQGSKITISIDGSKVDVLLPDYWTAGLPYSNIFYDYEVVVNVPEGTEELSFSWTSGSYPEECVFQIYSPANNLVASGGPSHPDGEIKFNSCDS